MANDLRKNRGSVRVQVEMFVLDKKPSNPSKIDAWEEVLEVDVQDPLTTDVIAGVSCDGKVSFEPVCKDTILLDDLFCFNVVQAILKVFRQTTLG